MSRKVIVLNGSPRTKGNTSALVAEFARGARELGCEVEIFQLDKMNIIPGRLRLKIIEEEIFMTI